MWFVGPTPGERCGGLYNPTPSKTLPTSGWRYAGKTWPDDPSLTITPGPLPPLPRQFTVTATGAAAEEWPECLGVFTRTERWWAGRPVLAGEGLRKDTKTIRKCRCSFASQSPHQPIC